MDPLRADRDEKRDEVLVMLVLSDEAGGLRHTRASLLQHARRITPATEEAHLTDPALVIRYTFERNERSEEVGQAEGERDSRADEQAVAPQPKLAGRCKRHVVWR